MAKEPFFSQDTILNNLRIGTSGVTEEAVFKICKWIRIHDDIMGLAQKYQTIVEPQGKNFSRGQKQNLELPVFCYRERRYIFWMR